MRRKTKRARERERERAKTDLNIISARLAANAKCGFEKSFAAAAMQHNKH